MPHEFPIPDVPALQESLDIAMNYLERTGQACPLPEVRRTCGVHLRGVVRRQAPPHMAGEQGHYRPRYIPSRDLIVMPERGAFLNPESLYAVWAHEHCHWAGHKTRLGPRPQTSVRPGRLRLVAEIGAAMACAHLQIKGELRHASNCEHWLRVLKKRHPSDIIGCKYGFSGRGLPSSFSEEKQERAA